MQLAQSYLTHGKEESTPKKLGKIVNKKPKCDKSHLSLDFIDVNNLSYCILGNATFSNYIMLVKL